MTDPTGRFRINWVAETTGVAEATLRAWERRYQIPKPARTASGYRLYSEADVAQVQRMRELCEAGIAPADAAQQVLREPSAPAPARPATPRDPVQGWSVGGPMTEVISPQHTNCAGVISLGGALEIMERAACIAVARTLRRTAVAVSCGGIQLLTPARLAQLVDASARLQEGHGDTVSVEVQLELENVESGERELLARSTLVLLLSSPKRGAAAASEGEQASASKSD